MLPLVVHQKFQFQFHASREGAWTDRSPPVVQHAKPRVALNDCSHASHLLAFSCMQCNFRVAHRPRAANDSPALRCALQSSTRCTSSCGVTVAMDSFAQRGPSRSQAYDGRGASRLNARILLRSDQAACALLRELALLRHTK